MKRTIKLLSLLGLLIFVTFGCDELNKDLLPSLELGETKYEVDASEQTLEIKVLTKNEFTVVSNADWITASIATVDDSYYIRLIIAGYDDLDRDRIGTVDVKLSNSDLERTLVITQKCRLVIQSDRKWFSLEPNEQTFEVSVKSNCEDYEVTISPEGKDWLTQVKTPGTKALSEKTLTFSAQENEGESDRSAEIILSIREINETDTIHVVQYGLNSMFLPYRLSKDSKCKLFYQAILATGLRDTLEQYMDDTYPYVNYDSTLQCYIEQGRTATSFETPYEHFDIIWPDRRLFKYTLFVVPDSILSAYGINTLEDLRQYARNIYQEGSDLPDYDRMSSLNKLISYHILPCELSYDQLNTRYTEIVNNYVKWDECDIEDFYETLLPHSIMRISTPKGAGDNPLGIFINRRGTEKNRPILKGTKITNMDMIGVESISLNGRYHYIDGLLLYDDLTRYDALGTRIRVLISTLSPDFINSGAHAQFTSGNGSSRQLAYSFKQGFCKNFYYDPYITQPTICPRFKYAPLGEQSIIRGVDVAFKLPSVPYDGNYEIRLLFNNYPIPVQGNTMMTQFSLFESDSPNPSGDFTTWNWTVCGDTVNIKQNPEKWVSDNDPIYDGLTQDQRMEAILANDKLLRESGYMKGMDIYSLLGNNETLRDDVNFFRKIVTNSYMSSNKNYYLRLKVIEGNGDINIRIPCIELVPKHIYAGPEPEDWH